MHALEKAMIRAAGLGLACILLAAALAGLLISGL